MTCYGQPKQPTVEVPITKFDSMLVQISLGTKAILDLETYKQEAEKLKADLAAKEIRFKAANERNAQTYRLADSLQAHVVSLKAVNSLQADNIKRLGSKPKSFAIGPSAGYGYALGAEIKRTSFIGITLTYSLIKF